MTNLLIYSQGTNERFQLYEPAQVYAKNVIVMMLLIIALISCERDTVLVILANTTSYMQFKAVKTTDQSNGGSR